MTTAVHQMPAPDITVGIRLLARLARVAEQACQTTGISLPQYRLLVSISGTPQRASELAARVGVSRPTLTSLVDGLEHAGLLRRMPVPSDRRGIQLAPTPPGRTAVEHADAALTERMLQLVSPETALRAQEVIEALCSSLDAEGEAQTTSARA